TDMPTAEQVAYIAIEAARAARNFGMEPRIAMIAYSNFGQPRGERSDQMSEAVRILDQRGVDFEYDGDMSAEVALNPDLRRLYPFLHITDTANVFDMPAIHAVSISTHMLKGVGGLTVRSPTLAGLTQPEQISQLGAMDNDILPV